MSSYISDFNIKSGATIDATDLAAAQAGVSNGGNARFLNVLGTGHGFSGNGKDKNSDITDIILAQNPDYAALFENTMQRVRDAEDAVDHVLQIATDRYNQSQAKLDDMINRAAELPDGTKVARSEKDDLIYTLDGVLVDQDEAAQIDWTGRENSLEDIQIAETRAESDFEILTGARHDEVRLGEIREEMETKPDADRLKEIGEELEIIRDRNIQTLDELNSSQSTAPTTQREFEVSGVSIPSL